MALPAKLFAETFPRVRQQAVHAGAPWGEPTWAYRAHLDELARVGCNPFLELLPKGVRRVRRARAGLR